MQESRELPSEQSDSGQRNTAVNRNSKIPRPSWVQVIGNKIIRLWFFLGVFIFVLLISGFFHSCTKDDEDKNSSSRNKLDSTRTKDSMPPKAWLTVRLYVDVSGSVDGTSMVRTISALTDEIKQTQKLYNTKLERVVLYFFSEDVVHEISNIQFPIQFPSHTTWDIEFTNFVKNKFKEIRAKGSTNTDFIRLIEAIRSSLTIPYDHNKYRNFATVVISDFRHTSKDKTYFSNMQVPGSIDSLTRYLTTQKIFEGYTLSGSYSPIVFIKCQSRPPYITKGYSLDTLLIKARDKYPGLVYYLRDGTAELGDIFERLRTPMTITIKEDWTNYQSSKIIGRNTRLQLSFLCTSTYPVVMDVPISILGISTSPEYDELKVPTGTSIVRTKNTFLYNYFLGELDRDPSPAYIGILQGRIVINKGTDNQEGYQVLDQSEEIITYYVDREIMALVPNIPGKLVLYFTNRLDSRVVLKKPILIGNNMQLLCDRDSIILYPNEVKQQEVTRWTFIPYSDLRNKQSMTSFEVPGNLSIHVKDSTIAKFARGAYYKKTHESFPMVAAPLVLKVIGPVEAAFCASVYPLSFLEWLFVPFGVLLILLILPISDRSTEENERRYPHLVAYFPQTEPYPSVIYHILYAFAVLGLVFYLFMIGTEPILDVDYVFRESIFSDVYKWAYMVIVSFLLIIVYWYTRQNDLAPIFWTIS